MVQIKRCPDCGLSKPLGEFTKNRATSDGLCVYCKPCYRTRCADAYRRKRGRLGKVVRERVDVPTGHKRCPQCALIKPLSEWGRNASARDGYTTYCKRCKAERDRVGRIKRVYGVSQAELDDMLAAQGGLCAICRLVAPDHVDHDHATGAVRGLLCINCNQGLGQFRENLEVMDAAIDYLFSHQPRTKALRDLPMIVTRKRFDLDRVG